MTLPRVSSQDNGEAAVRQAVPNSIAMGQAFGEDTEGLFSSAGPPGAKRSAPGTF